MQNVCVGDETDACANSGRLTVNMSMAFDTHGQTKTTSTCFSRTFFGRICFGSVLAVIVQCFFYHSRHIGKIPASVLSTEALATTVANKKKIHVSEQNPHQANRPTKKGVTSSLLCSKFISFSVDAFSTVVERYMRSPNTTRYDIYIYISSSSVRIVIKTPVCIITFWG